MAEFTLEDFQELAIDVANHISKRGGLFIGYGWNCSQDRMWAAKQEYADQILRRFQRVILLAGCFSKNKSFLIATMEHPNIKDVSYGTEPFFSNDIDDPMNNRGKLKSIFDLFLTDLYTPPDDNNSLSDHLQALKNYYAEIGKHLNNIPPSTPQRIDFAMTKATGLALEKIGHSARSARHSIARTDKSSQTIKDKCSPLNSQIERVIAAEISRTSLTQNAKIKIIQRSWGTHYPGEKPPGRTKIHNFFNDRKLSTT